MQTEQTSIVLPPPLYHQFMRLKSQGRFDSDQAMMQACLEALERGWERRSREAGMGNPIIEPYMPRPGLGMDDYDT